MKHLKKIAGLLLAVVMMFAMCVTASAANVTIAQDLSKHSFVAYQIFTGTQNANDNALGEIAWGNGVDSSTFITNLKNDSTIGNKFTNIDAENQNSASEVAKVLGELNNEGAKIVAKLALNSKSGNGTALEAGTTTLDSGYYLIVDNTDVTNKDDAKNAALLQVTSDIEITKKTDKPSVEKKVLENTKYNQDGGYGQKYNDVADYNIGDEVPFKLIGTIPDTTYYNAYKYTFHDTLSSGLTAPNVNNIKVYLSTDKEGTNKAELTTGFTKDVNGQNIRVQFNDLKTVTGISNNNYILVEYNAVLNSGAEIGLPGNTNEVYLTYSNNPDQSGEGGKTPEDKVIVFTYELDTTKTNNDGTKNLPGAEFKLRKGNKWAVIDKNSKVVTWENEETKGSTLTSDKNGLFKVIGLDDGIYYLRETKAPGGYNKLKDDITIEIKATTSNGQKWESKKASDALTALQIKVGTSDYENGDTNTGVVGATVKNSKGSTLPETGGIGTTIFYVIGVVLMLGAGVLLITKRRMSAKR